MVWGKGHQMTSKNLLTKDVVADFTGESSLLNPLPLVTWRFSLTSTLRLSWTFRAWLQQLVRLSPPGHCVPDSLQWSESGPIPLPRYLRSGDLGGLS